MTSGAVQCGAEASLEGVEEKMGSEKREQLPTTLLRSIAPQKGRMNGTVYFATQFPLQLQEVTYEWLWTQVSAKALKLLVTREVPLLPKLLTGRLR